MNRGTLNQTLPYMRPQFMDGFMQNPMENPMTTWMINKGYPMDSKHHLAHLSLPPLQGEALCLRKALCQPAQICAIRVAAAPTWELH